MPATGTEQLLQVVATEAGIRREAVEILTRREGRLVGRAPPPSGTDAVVKVSAKAADFAAEAAAARVLGAAGLPVSRVRLFHDGPPSLIALDWTPPARATYGGVNADLVGWIDGWCDYAGCDTWLSRALVELEHAAGGRGDRSSTYGLN